MPTHVAILFHQYIDLILAGEKTVESRLTLTPRSPYRRINPGDVIYFKASSGSFMASAVAGAVEFHDKLTPAKVAALHKRWNGRVRGDDAFWRWKRNSRYATFVELREVRPVNRGPHLAPSRGLAWFTLDDSMAPKPLEIPLTAGAIRNGYVAAPTGMKADGSKIQLVLPDGRAVETDVFRRRLRWRGWRSYFQTHRVEPGDRVRLDAIGPRKYRVSFEGAGGKPPLPLGEGRGEGTSKLVRSPKNTTRHRSTAPSPQPSPGRPSGAGRGSAFQNLFTFITKRRLKVLIREARDEDLGPSHIDVTSELLIPKDATARAVVRSRKSGRLGGAAILPFVIQAYDPAIKLDVHLHDGDRLTPGAPVAELSGNLRSILAIERVALNFLTHLSGIASLTARFVAETAGTQAKIYDTRKTHPGLRGLEKYAVVCGGGHAHRMGLHDAVLVKDNHVAHLSLDKLSDALSEMVQKARAPGTTGTRKPPPAFIMVEVDTLDQLRRVLPLGIDIVLLDNMTPEEIRQAVAARKAVAPHVELEVSGGVTLDTVRAIAQTGVDRISIGGLTHSAPALDLGLDIE